MDLKACIQAAWGATYIVVLLLLPFGNQIQAQQYNRTELSVINGLGQGGVLHISQDSLGYIWINQHLGVTLFNGREFRQIIPRPDDSTALPTAEVNHVSHTADGNAWLSHIKGLSYFSRKTNEFTTYTRKDGLHCDLVVQTSLEGDSVVWASHWYGYDRFSLKTHTSEWIRPFPQVQDSIFRHRSPNFVNHPKENPYNSNQIFSIHQNNLYVLHKDTRKISSITQFKIGQSEPLKDAFYLLEYEWIDSSRLLINFFPNKGELYEYNLVTAELRPFPVIPGVSLWVNKIQRIAEHKFLCLDIERGLFSIDMETPEVKFLDPAVSQNRFSTFFRDAQEVIWAGSGGYVYRYEPSEIITYFGGAEGFYLWHEADPATGIFIVGTYGEQEVFQFKNKSIEPVDFPQIEKLSNNTFFHPHLGKFINITDGRLYVFHPATKQFTLQPLTGINVFTTLQDYACTSTGFYMAVLNNIFFVDFSGKAELILQAQTDIHEVEYGSGHLFYSTFGYVYAYDILQRSTQEIFHLDETSYIPLLLHQQTLWMLWREGMKYINIDTPGYAIKEFPFGKLTLDQNFNLLTPNGEQIMLSAAYKLIVLNAQSRAIDRVYTHLDRIDIGYWDDSFTRMADHYLLTTDSKKILAFPEKLKSPAFLSYQLVHIEITDHRKVYGDSTFVLRDDENDIVISSDAVYTGVFDQLEYYYRNSKVSNEWLPAPSSVLQLPNQKPGQYSIDLRVTDRYGQERILEKAAVFKILPPWYQSRLFYAAAFLTTLGLSYALYTLRLRQVQRNFEIQTKLQQLEMTALKAQMNPHFIFNCLNSIKGLILIGESDKAVNYIATFSKLVRSSLDSAEEKLITLKEEFEIAENYLSLERLRFGPRLDWKIRCQDESLLTSVKLPPFVLQPLIENAVVHGIKNIKHNGFIHITAYRELDKIYIKVIDNGIGMQKSMDMDQKNEHSTRKHLGVSLVRRRLNNIHATLSIYEHQDHAGNAAGTISEIRIPTGP